MTIKKYAQRISQLAKKHPNAIVLRENSLCNYSVLSNWPKVGYGRFEPQRIFFSRNRPMDGVSSRVAILI